MAKRRADGEGTIFKLPDGRWAAEISLGYENGKRVRKRVSAKTQEEVTKKIRDVKHKAERGIKVSLDRITVQQLSAEWLLLIKAKRSASTYRIREMNCRLYIVPNIGKIAVSKLTVNDVQRVLDKYAKEGKRKNTISSIKTTLQSLIKEAQRRSIVHQNVASLAELPEAITPPRPKRGLSPDEAKALLQALKGDRFETAVIIMLSLGLRRGETFGLCWKDIDFENQTLTVNGNLQYIDKQWQIVKPKTIKSNSKIPIPSNLIQLLKAYKARQELQKRIMGEKWQDNDLVFTRNDGTPVPEPTFSKHFKVLLKRKGLEKITPHELRHSCATILFAQGVDPKLIQTILRHANISITLDTYTHLLPGATASALAGMNSILETGG